MRVGIGVKMWFTLGKLALKTGTEIYKNRKRAKLLESEAEVKHLERVVAGEIEHKKVTVAAQQGDWKDEFCLILISIPLLLLAWSVFSDDPNIQAKIDIFFDKFSNLPTFSALCGIFSNDSGVQEHCLKKHH